MIKNIYENETYRCVTFNHSDSEWEHVRNLCLEEDNWLRENYVPEKCIVEDHDIFSITYVKETGLPICFAGIYNNGRYPKQVGRCLNRFYLFPEYRTSDLRKRMYAIYSLIVPAMVESSPFKRDLLFISMQARNRDYSGEQHWWRIWKKIWLGFDKNWIAVDGMTQVVAGEDPRGFQNIVYKSYGDFTFKDWNPTVMNYSDYYKYCERYYKINE